MLGCKYRARFLVNGKIFVINKRFKLTICIDNQLPAVVKPLIFPISPITNDDFVLCTELVPQQWLGAEIIDTLPVIKILGIRNPDSTRIAFTMSGYCKYDYQYIRVDQRGTPLTPFQQYCIKIIQINELNPAKIIDSAKDFLMIIRGRFCYRIRVGTLLNYLSSITSAGFIRRKVIKIEAGNSGYLNKDLTLNKYYINLIFSRIRAEMAVLLERFNNAIQK